MCSAAIAPIARAFVAAPKRIEAQTGDDQIKPVLRALGHSFEIQASLRTPDGSKKPDYICWRSTWRGRPRRVGRCRWRAR